MFRRTRSLRHLVDAEIAQSRQAEARGRFHTAFQHLERAHVLGQRATLQHLRVHGLMLGLALRNRWHGEVWGQVWRLLAAAIFTPLGLLPKGNTGSSRVSGFRAMPVPDELQRLIDRAQ